MIRICSKGCSNVLRALAKIKPKSEERNFSIHDICQENQLPESATRKLFQSLVRKGLLSATQGPGGGYRFRKKPEEISVYEIIETIDGPTALTTCIMGRSECLPQETGKCALHPIWKGFQTTITEQLRGIKIADLMEKSSAEL